MPNHITNIITITGEQEKVQEVIDKCGTIHPRIPQTAYDGGLIFNSKDGHSYGWYYPDTDIFKRRDEPDVQGVPEGYTQEYREEFLQFPDFDKIIPMPESMHITSGSNVDNAIAVLSDDRAEFRRFLQYPAWQDMLQQASLPLTEDGMKEYMYSKLSEKDLEEGRIAINNLKVYGCKDWYDWSKQYWGTKWNAYDCKSLSDNSFRFDTAWNTPEPVIQSMSEQFPDVEIHVEYADEDFGSNVGEYTYLSGDCTEEGNYAGTPYGRELATKLLGWSPEDEEEEDEDEIQ